MRLTSITRAAGCTLARDLPVVSGSPLPLLRAGSPLTPRLVSLLDDKGFKAVYVEDDLSAGVDPVELVPEHVRSEEAARVADALRGARDAFASKQRIGDAIMADIADVVERIARNLVEAPDAALAFADLAGADEYTHRHSVDVTALGLLLAREHWRLHGWIDHAGRRRFDGIKAQLTKLGLGLLLHDVGKMAIPLEILNKRGALDEREWGLMRQHPQTGFEVLDTATVSRLTRSVVLDHHERIDGSGYPRGLSGSSIHEFSRIAAIADVYDAVTSERPYRPAQPAAAGVAVITAGRGTAFDPEMVDTFRRLVFPYPAGSEVPLPDGRTGVVVSVDPARPESPVVRVEDGQGGMLELELELEPDAQLLAA